MKSRGLWNSKELYEVRLNIFVLYFLGNGTPGWRAYFQWSPKPRQSTNELKNYMRNSRVQLWKRTWEERVIRRFLISWTFLPWPDPSEPAISPKDKRFSDGCDESHGEMNWPVRKNGSFSVIWEHSFAYCWKEIWIAPALGSAIEANASSDRSMVPWHLGAGQWSMMVTVTVLLPRHGFGMPWFVLPRQVTWNLCPQAAPLFHSCSLAAPIIVPCTSNPKHAEAAHSDEQLYATQMMIKKQYFQRWKMWYSRIAIQHLRT